LQVAEDEDEEAFVRTGKAIQCCLAGERCIYARVWDVGWFGTYQCEGGVIAHGSQGLVSAFGHGNQQQVQRLHSVAMGLEGLEHTVEAGKLAGGRAIAIPIAIAAEQ
jgi:hypothetical protein